VVGSWRAVHQLVGTYSFGIEQASTYRDTPIDLVYADADFPPTCFVIDPARSLKTTRWAVSAADPCERAEADGRLLVSVREIDGEYAKRLLRQSPNLLTREGGEVQSEHDAIRRLRRYVHIRVWTKLVVTLADASAGHAIRLLDGADTD
jgi:hypothetical protein